MKQVKKKNNPKNKTSINKCNALKQSIKITAKY